MDLVFGSGHCSDAVAALQPRLAERTWKVEPARDKINVSVLSGQGNLVWGGECHRCVGRRTWPSLAHHTGLSLAMDQINCGFFRPPRTENPPFSTLNPPSVIAKSSTKSGSALWVSLPRARRASPGTPTPAPNPLVALAGPSPASKHPKTGAQSSGALWNLQADEFQLP